MIPGCIKDLGQRSTSIAWFQYWNKCHMHPQVFYIIQQLYKEELWARFWVKGFKVKVDQDKISLYLKRARSLVLMNAWPQEAGEMILGLSGHVGIWAAQALPLGAAFPPLHPCWKAGQLTMFSRELQSIDFNASN